jgi:uncharacterized protein
MTSINVAGLLREPPGAIRDVALRDHYTSLGPDVELAGPLDVDLRLQRTNRGILLRGDVRGSLRRTCARCADPFVEEVAVQVSEEFLPSLDPETGAVLTAPAEDEGALRIDVHNEIDLDPVLHDELALSEPMHPLCAPDCPGLCAECGMRLDAAHRQHAEDEIDPRLAGLAALLQRSDGDGNGERH